MAAAVATMTHDVARTSHIPANSPAGHRHLIEIFGKSAPRDLLELSL
ncbi:hypothetical protein [Bradyrhizobium sp. CCH5-F6]|jgi:hypothetical protein|nr:hypothetical protein [Bradyrhizobium sp. CCH5-F6]